MNSTSLISTRIFAYLSYDIFFQNYTTLNAIPKECLKCSRTHKEDVTVVTYAQNVAWPLDRAEQSQLTAVRL